MTKKQFYEALRQKTAESGLEWTLLGGERVRVYSQTFLHCPLSFVAGTFPCSVTPLTAKLRLDETVASNIAAAADHPEARGRKALLKACGLEA